MIIKRNRFLQSPLILKNLSLGIILPIFFYKSLIFFQSPRIYAEEGTVYLNDALSNGLMSIFHSHLGYYAIIPSFTLYISTLFDLKYVPIFTLAISLVTWIFLFVFANNSSGKVFRRMSFIERNMFSMIIFFIVTSVTEIFLSTIALQFITPLILLLLLDLDDKSLKKFPVIYVAICILMLNGVPALVILPLVVWRFWNSKFLIVILGLVIIQLFAVLNGGARGEGTLERVISNFLSRIDNTAPDNFHEYWWWVLFFILSLIFFLRKNRYLSCLFFSVFLSFCFIYFAKDSFGNEIAGRYIALLSSLSVFSILYASTLLIQSPYFKYSIYSIILGIAVYKSDNRLMSNFTYCETSADWIRIASKEFKAGKTVQIHPCSEIWQIKLPDD